MYLNEAISAMNSSHDDISVLVNIGIAFVMFVGLIVVKKLIK